jgi:hypothetical protein
MLLNKQQLLLVEQHPSRWRFLLSLCGPTGRLPSPGGLFSLAFDARFFVMFSTAGFCENAVLLNLAIEALQSSLE